MFNSIRISNTAVGVLESNAKHPCLPLLRVEPTEREIPESESDHNVSSTATGAELENTDLIC